MLGNRRLALLLAVALLVRLAAAWVEPLFVDEAFSYYVARSPLGDLWAAARGDAHPPTYYLLLRPIALITRNALALRLPSVLCSVAALAVSYRIAERLGGPRVALATTALQGLSYFSWHGELQARSNAALELAYLIVLWDLVAGLSSRALLAYLAAPALNLFGLVGVVGLTALSRHRSRARLAAAGTAVALTLAWALQAAGNSALTATRGVNGAEWLNLPVNALGLELPGFWSVSFRPITMWVMSSGGSLAVAAFGWGCLAAVLVRGSREERLAAAATLLPWLGLIVLSVWRGGSWYQVRYLMPYLFGLYYGVARLLVRGAWPALALWCVLHLGTWLAFLRDPFFWNQDWPQAAAFARQQRVDRVLIYHPYNLFGLAYAYDPGVRFRFGPVRMEGATPGLPPLEQLHPAMLGPDFWAGLRGQRVAVIVCQAAPQDVLTEMAPRSQLLGGMEQTSLHSWGLMRGYLLQF